MATMKWLRVAIERRSSSSALRGGLRAGQPAIALNACLLPRGKEGGLILSPPPVLRGRARVGAAAEFSIDGRLHRFWMAQDVIVGEADNPDVMIKQRSAALFVILYALLVIVLATVGLDTQTRGQTTEIDDVACNRHLPTKVKAIQLAAPQQIPELLFGVGGRLPHSPRKSD